MNASWVLMSIVGLFIDAGAYTFGALLVIAFLMAAIHE